MNINNYKKTSKFNDFDILTLYSFVEYFSIGIQNRYFHCNLINKANLYYILLFYRF